MLKKLGFHYPKISTWKNTPQKLRQTQTFFWILYAENEYALIVVVRILLSPNPKKSFS